MLDLLLPRPCVGCGHPDGPWCETCRCDLRPGLIERPVPIGPGGLLLGGLVGDGADGDLHVVGSAPYAGGCRRLLLAFKEAGRHEVADVLGDLLARSALGAAVLVTGSDALADGIRLVPVPSRPHARRQRGADLGVVLARAAVARLRRAGWSAAVDPLLRHVSGSADQAGLTRTGRARNVVDTLVARSTSPSRSAARARYLLVDDIVTTGATLREAARAMTAAGHRVGAAAVVAATPLGSTIPLS